MTTSSINPHAIRPVLVDVRGTHLQLTPDRDFDNDNLHHDWSRDIIQACAGPFDRITVDLSYRTMISSTFFAGALRLLDHYRHERLQRITLCRVSTRIARTIEMMNMREAFTILPDEAT